MQRESVAIVTGSTLLVTDLKHLCSLQKMGFLLTQLCVTLTNPQELKRLPKMRICRTRGVRTRCNK